MFRVSQLSAAVTRGFLHHRPAIHVLASDSLFYFLPRSRVWKESFAFSAFSASSFGSKQRFFSTAVSSPKTLEQLENEYSSRVQKYDEAVADVKKLEAELKKAAKKKKAEVQMRLKAAKRDKESMRTAMDVALAVWNEAKKKVPKTEIEVIALATEILKSISPDSALTPRSSFIGMADHSLGTNTLQQDEAKTKAREYLSKKEPDKNNSSRSGCEICSIWAAPGSGKSHILDDVANIAAIDLGQRAVLVTFNGKMPIALEEKKNPSLALACRLLFALFDFGSKFVEFQTAFYKALKRKSPYSFENPSLSVVEAYRKKFSYESLMCIGIDEVTKICDNEKKILPFYNSITTIIDNNSSNRIVVSTLDSKGFLKGVFGPKSDEPDPGKLPFSESSNRPITWLVLKPIREIVSELMKQKNAEELFPALKYKDHPGFKWLITLCGGNPRSLSFLINMEFNSKDWKRSFLDLLSKCLEWSHYCPSEEHALTTLSYSLVGALLYIKDHSFVSSLVMGGWLLTGADPKSNSIPSRISIFLLYNWANTTKSSPIKEHIKQLIIDGHDGSTQSFESFHARFEVIRMWAFVEVQGKKSLSLKDWYGDKAIEFINGKSEMKLDLLPEKGQLGTFEKLKSQIWDSANPSSKPVLKQNTMYLAASHQMGFDSIQLVQDAETKKIKFLFTDNKYSRGKLQSVDSVYSQTRVPLLLEDVAHKVAKIKEMLSFIQKDFPDAKEEDLVLIIVAMRDIEPDYENWKNLSYSDLVASRNKEILEASKRVLGRDRKSSTEAKDAEWEKKKGLEHECFRNFGGAVYIVPRESVLQFYGPTFAECGAFALVEFEEGYSKTTG